MDSESITRKKVVIIGLALLAFIAIPISVYVVNRSQKQNTTTNASVAEDNVVVAQFNGVQITKGQVRDVAEEQNDPTAVDAQALRSALAILEERKILDKAAVDLGITPDAQKVAMYKAKDLSDTEAKYEALRSQVILKVVKSREAASIEFWNPPSPEPGLLSVLSVEEQSIATAELSAGIPALTKAEAALKRGEDILATGDSLLAGDPVLEPVLAVNGFILHNLTDADRQIAKYPQIYEYGDTALDDTTRDGLFAMNVGEVKKFSGTEANQGGKVFKLTVKNDTTVTSYEEWLLAQKAELVQDLNKL